MPVAARCCPSCGYDLTGVINSWNDHCPLHGTCPECGYAIRWAALLGNPRYRAHPAVRSPRVAGWFMLSLLFFTVFVLMIGFVLWS